MAVTPGSCQATSVCNREMGRPGGGASRIAGRRFFVAMAGRELKLSDHSSPRSKRGENERKEKADASKR
jgi:hypothetical protein